MFGNDLTAMAKRGELDPVIGGEKQIERLMVILCKRRKNNACLIGDPGVGKTALVEALASNIANASAPPKLTAKKVFSIDMGRLIAGASNRGEFEQRLITLIDEVKQSKGSVILFIDELHTLIGAGAAAAAQPLDAANILKPALARGHLKCIGATTLEEYKKYIEKDSALNRRFQAIHVPEPSTDEAIEILKGQRNKYEIHHSVKYTDTALIAAVHLSKQYISNRYLPDKAIDLIDEAGARAQLHRKFDSYAAPAPAPAPAPLINNLQLVTEEDIAQLVSMWTGIPVEKISDEESIRLLSLENTLKRRVIGQDEAVSAVSRAVRRGRVGLRDMDKPVATFLFTGPTGVGKTQLAKSLAIEYFGSKEAMVRLDMSEYMEKHCVSRLVGAPPGYIGHGNGGQLTEAVRRRPHNVILFDEIEKANSQVLNVLLQILDDGRLTDGEGRTVDFRNTIIIMTSNIGGNIIKGGGDYSEVEKQLKQFLKPEFLNRIDEIIVFKHLEKVDAREIVDGMVVEFYERAKKKHDIEVEVRKGLKKKVVSEGYSASYGARGLRRAISRLVEDELAEKILNGSVSEGDRVTMDVDSSGDEVEVLIFSN